MPRRLLRDGEIVADEWRTADEWRAAHEQRTAAKLAEEQRTAHEDGVPDEGPLMLSFAEWRASRERWLARSGPLGVILEPGDRELALVPDLPRLALVAAEFPSVSEGRGYSQARLLRERWGFTRELRARGAIRRDQVFLLARCGFNSFELPEDELSAAAAALRTFSAAYQPANDRGLRTRLNHR